MPSFFPKISKIQFEGTKSRNPLAFKHRNPDEIVEARSMKEHPLLSEVYRHIMCGVRGDMLRWGTAQYSWETDHSTAKDAQQRAIPRLGRPTTRQDLEGINLEPRRRGRCVETETNADGHQAGWGATHHLIKRSVSHGASTYWNAHFILYATVRVKEQSKTYKKRQ